MKKLFNLSGLLLAIIFAACADFPVENPDPELENATRASADTKAGNYYWSGGQKIWLDTDYTQMIVDFSSEQELKAFGANISKENPFTEGTMVLVDVREESIKQKLDTEKYVKNRIFAHKFSGYNTPFYMTGEIVMQPKEGISMDDILAKCGVDAETVNKTDIGVIVRLKDWNTILSTANTIYESGMVDWCHPDFISQKSKMTNDQYFQYQYYLKNTGQTGGTRGVDINVEPAWAISTGTGIRVAVIDDGVEAHDDLAGRVLQGYTPKNSTGYGKPTSAGYHGQACAGIIAASHNISYIAGVAPGVVIIPINNFYGGETVYDDAAAIEYAWNPNKGNADVINNSWKYENGPPSNADVFNQQINNAVNSGRLRNGVRKGCVVVFASGNSMPYEPVSYPASLSNVIAVGAVDKYGTVWDYSCRGSALDVVAPSGDIGYGDVYTLDRMGANGYEAGNYTSRFGGTSAAAPHVAGVAALMLSLKPSLTRQQVVDAIEQSAQKVKQNNPYIYEAKYAHPNGLWNDQVGYGLVDAHAALSYLGVGQPLAGGTIYSASVNLPSIAGQVLLSNSRSASGGTGSYAYQWQVNFNYGMSSDWTDIQSSTGATCHLPAYALSGTTYFRRKVTSGSSVAYSNTLSFAIQYALNGGLISGDGSIMRGAFTDLTSYSHNGSNPNIVFLWEQSTDGLYWTNASGVNNTYSYRTPSLYQRTFYRLRVSLRNGTSSDYGYSNTLTINVN